MMRWRIFFCVLCVVSGTLNVVACKGDEAAEGAKNAAKDGADEGAKRGALAAWSAPAAQRELSSLGGDDFRELILGESERFPACREIFEEAGAPRAEFPLKDPQLRALTLGGCGVEATQTLDDGARLIAYSLPEAEGDGKDLRLLYYAENGELLWHATMDRGENAENFRANFRSSFIAPMLPRMVCFGTLWQGGTQAHCVKAESGERVWGGTMGFWAGVEPQPVGTSMVSAGVSGLTQRYPYSGVEMRTKKFEATGGRSSLYLSDDEAIYFATSKAGAPRLSSYHIEDFDVNWTRGLPGEPLPNWGASSAELGVLLLKIDETIYALDREGGAPLWALRVGDDRPALAFHGGNIFSLIRREEQPNLLLKLDPKSGDIAWVAESPAGALELVSVEEELMLKSIRALQRVDLAAMED